MEQDNVLKGQNERLPRGENTRTQPKFSSSGKYIILYLAAIITANMITVKFGPGASIFNAFMLIGLDLTTRDKLHDAWDGRGLWWKMALLIGAGSAISYLLNRDAGRVALASLAAFAASGAVDAVIYHLLRDKTRLVKVNGSNVFSAAVDSLIFPAIAFGGFMPLIVLGQFAAKVAGGFLWSLMLRKGANDERNIYARVS